MISMYKTSWGDTPRFQVLDASFARPCFNPFEINGIDAWRQFEKSDLCESIVISLEIKRDALEHRMLEHGIGNWIENFFPCFFVVENQNLIFLFLMKFENFK